MSVEDEPRRGVWARLWNALNHQVVGGIVLIAIGLLVGSGGGPVANIFDGGSGSTSDDPTDTRLTLLRPRAGSDIAQTPVVRGTVTHLPTGYVVWVLNQRRASGRPPYFVADGPCDIDGSEWTCDSGVAVGGPVDAGRQFTLEAVAIPPELQRKFIEYLRYYNRRVQDEGELSHLPSTKRVSVTRELSPGR